MALHQMRLPDIGEGIAEAEIVAWHVHPGEYVQEDQPLADVMTDKATIEIPSPVYGVVIALHGDVGTSVAVGAILVELDAQDTDLAMIAGTTQPIPAPAVLPTQEMPPAPKGSLVLAAPATRRRAKELGISLNLVPATGMHGQITANDLDRYLAEQKQPVSNRRTTVHEQKIIGLRRQIAEHVQDAKRRIPHFGYVEEFDMTALEELRATLNANRNADTPTLTLLPFFMRAIAQLQPEFPQFNARYDDGAGILRLYEGVHIGIATHTPNGLLVPIVRNVEALDLWGCAREVARIAAAAREGSVSRDDLTGSTITLTSLGALGGISTTPVINAPEVAIIGVNRMESRPVVRNGQIVIRTMMNVSSAFDHRIIDGHDAATFIQRLKQLVELPAPPDGFGELSA